MLWKQSSQNKRLTIVHQRNRSAEPVGEITKFGNRDLHLLSQAKGVALSVNKHSYKYFQPRVTGMWSDLEIIVFGN